MSVDPNQQSELAYIDIDNINKPMELFNKWLTEFKWSTKSDQTFFSLATSSAEGKVSNRTVVLRQLLEESFVFITHNQSKKIANITENPKVAACFLLNCDIDDKTVWRQVSVEGVAKKLPEQICRELYENEPLYCKIRGHICDQGKEIQWEELKVKHDELLKDVIDNQRQLEMPKSLVAYEIVPNSFEFYHAFIGEIADKIVFKKNDQNQWISHRIAA